MKFPDPNDCTPNKPCLLLSPSDVLKISNTLTQQTVTTLTEDMREAFITKARNYGWTGVTFLGKQCLLHVEFFGAPALHFPK